jgi:recombination protein RecT
MLGSDDLVDRFLSVALHSISTDSYLLLNATPESIIQAIRDSATLGLEPTGLTGEAWIVVFKGTAKLMPGWRGYIRRIRNSKQVQDIDVQLVYANDQFDYGYNQTGGYFDHHPAKPVKDPTTPGEYLDPRGGYWGVYAYAVMPSGFVELEVMTEADVNYVRDHFSESVRSGKKSPWDDSYGEMARKTVLRRLAKRLPQEAVEQLLRLDAAVDEAARESAEETRRIAPSAARQAALRAIGAEVVNVSTEEPEGAPEAVTEAVEAEVVEQAVVESDLSDLPDGWR